MRIIEGYNVKKKMTVFIVIVLTFIRIILKNGSPWMIFILSGGADDWYQAEASINILNGDWLGKYSWVTLSKGVSYPLFVALSKMINLPLGLSMGFFLSITSAIAAVAVFPIVKETWSRCMVYLLLLYSPIFFAPSSLQLYRNALIPIASLGVIATAVAAYLRRKNIKKVFFWTLIESLYLSFFWYLREDSIWILPFCLAASLITLIGLCIENKKISIAVLSLLIICLPYFTTEIYTLSVKHLNYDRYGLYVINDRTETAYADLLGLLFKIDDPNNHDSDIWLSRNSIEKAIDVSPTLSTIKEPLMEMRDSWAGGIDSELKCDLFGWIIRIVADRVGLYENPVETNAFYENICNELETAYNDGLLEERNAIFISSQTGGFQVEDFIDTFVISIQAVKGILNYNQCTISINDYNREIDGDNNLIMQAEFVLGNTLNRSTTQLQEIGAYPMNDAVNEIVEQKRVKNATISNAIVNFFKLFNWIYLVVLFVIILVAIEEKKEFFAFLCENLVWIFGVSLTAYLNLYLVTLYNLWRTRDPMSNVAEYYAPSVYIFVDFIKVILLAWAIPKALGLIARRLKNV